MKDFKQARTASIIALLAGLWLIIAPTVMGYVHANPRTNDVWVGFIVGILALIRLVAPQRLIFLSWVNVVLGIWLIIAPFVLGYVGIVPLWNDVILGIIVAVMAIWSSNATSHIQHHRHATA